MAAWLYWVGAPRDTEIAGLDAEGGLALDPAKVVTIGRVPDADILVRQPQIGGRRNSTVAFENGAWRLHHMGHSLPIFHDDRILPRGDAALAHGDLFGPITVNGDRITFLFLTNDGVRRGQALPAIESAVRTYFPDRAAALLREVWQWFASEPFAGAEGVAHALHCGLCGCFRRADRVVDVEAFRPAGVAIRFQVLADSEHRLGNATYPSMGFCEKCLADPDQTFRGADDADRLRADLERALDAADPESRDLVVRDLDRRFAFAQPRRGRGLCTLCLLGEANLPERVLRGCTGTICRSCLRGASAIRHIRG